MINQRAASCPNPTQRGSTVMCKRKGWINREMCQKVGYDAIGTIGCSRSSVDTFPKRRRREVIRLENRSMRLYSKF